MKSKNKNTSISTSSSAIKKILIAVDYNRSAEKVITTGYALANAISAQLVLVHVIVDAASYSLAYSDFMHYDDVFFTNVFHNYDDLKKEASNFLDKIVSDLKDDAIETFVLEGDIEDAILKCAEEQKIDLIVMGSHRHRGIDRLLVTDVATHVLKKSKTPLLTIPNRSELDIDTEK